MNTSFSLLEYKNDIPGSHESFVRQIQLAKAVLSDAADSVDSRSDSYRDADSDQDAGYNKNAYANSYPDRNAYSHQISYPGQNAESDKNADFDGTARTSDHGTAVPSIANSSTSLDGHDASVRLASRRVVRRGLQAAQETVSEDTVAGDTVAGDAVAGDTGAGDTGARGAGSRDDGARKLVAGGGGAGTVARGANQSKAELSLGCLFAYDLPGGADMLAASVMAVEEINGDPSILPNHVLHLTVQNYSIADLASQLAAFELLKNHPVAVIGPHTSDQAARFSPLAAATQVPFISPSATDVQLTLGAHRPYFMRTVASDGVQMTAMAALIKHYKWKQVALIYSDDRFGRNGVAALSTQLLSIKAEADVVARVPIPPSATRDGVQGLMSSLLLLDVAVYVLHASPDAYTAAVEAAQRLSLLRRSSVWISSEAAAVISASTGQRVDGLIFTATYVPPSARLTSFLDRWKQLNASQYPGLSRAKPSPYALSSHDAVTLVATALHTLLYPPPAASRRTPSKALHKGKQQQPMKQQRVQQQQQPGGQQQAFQQLNLPLLPPLPNGTDDALVPEITHLRRSTIGPTLWEALLKTSFVGLQGRMSFTPHGDMAVNETLILNIQPGAPVEVGRWSSTQGLIPNLRTSSAPTASRTGSGAPAGPGPVASPTPGPVTGSSGQALNDLPIIFPGGLTQVPTGSFPKTRVRIAVPNKQQYKEYVNVSDAFGEGNARFSGYCVELFRLAVTRLPYELDYDFVLYGDESLSYTQMVLAVANKTYDVAVGDITVLDSRSKVVYFTHPIQQSGLGVIGYSRPYTNPWLAFDPFTPAMWAVTAALCVFTGLVAVLLDGHVTPAFQGKLHTRMLTAVWYGWVTFYNIPVYHIRSTLARIVVSLWLLLSFIIATSYTASLTSILTQQKLVPQILDIYSALTSNSPIGYQQGSFVHAYLLQLGVAPDKLISLAGESEFSSSLSSGRVTVIVDEDPYLNLLAAAFCDVAQAPQPFSVLNLAFAFPKGSQLGVDISQAIIDLQMLGELERLKTQYLQKDSICSDDQSNSAVFAQLDAQKFSALFILYAAVSVLCCTGYVALLIHRGYRYIQETHGHQDLQQWHMEQQEGELWYGQEHQEHQERCSDNNTRHPDLARDPYAYYRRDNDDGGENNIDNYADEEGEEDDNGRAGVRGRGDALVCSLRAGSSYNGLSCGLGSWDAAASPAGSYGSSSKPLLFSSGSRCISSGFAFGAGVASTSHSTATRNAAASCIPFLHPSATSAASSPADLIPGASLPYQGGSRHGGLGGSRQGSKQLAVLDALLEEDGEEGGGGDEKGKEGDGERREADGKGRKGMGSWGVEMRGALSPLLL
ncbi:hypothetical protein CLOM_g11439 [Closterium sp. NIES-68]|nr:hypothetical protein CLOM_g11439 [Closterium sp. NIES-68]